MGNKTRRTSVADVKIEIRQSPASRAVSNDVARDIAHNHLHGNIVIVVAGNPAFAHAAFRKQWLHVLRLVERKQASSIHPQTLTTLARKIADMQALCFTTLAGGTDSAAVVQFATVAELVRNPQPCKVLYLTLPVSDEALQKMSNNMLSGGTIVRYLRPELKSEYAAILQHPWRLPM